MWPQYTKRNTTRFSLQPLSVLGSGLGSGSSTKYPAPSLSYSSAAITADTLLERVNLCRIQRADGDCDLAAVILHVRRRRICVSPHSHVIKQWMKEQTAKKDAKGNFCHKKKHAGQRKSKGAHQGKPEIHSHESSY
ncbi:hypothetical protein GH733_004625 [Mirounga leonina]|nr:hypothetical protein GH733_004837 [Mirounga leonina]KAF3828719.1 hypothetical protein GH733_004625 [Mirounga leonina]